MSPSTINASAVVPSVAAATPVVADKDARLAVTAPTTTASPKDLRAFEHDRQRVKKVADRTKTRKGRWSALAKGEMYISSWKEAVQPKPTSEKTKLFRAEELELLEDDVAYHVARAVAPARTCAQPLVVEVQLADLVTLPKTHKRPVRDYVVIPHHSVIPLDDFELVRDLVIDEPWEHIYGVDDEDEDDSSRATTPTNGKPLSYADVLAMNSK